MGVLGYLDWMTDRGISFTGKFNNSGRSQGLVQ
jgi:hypothetical protein